MIKLFLTLIVFIGTAFGQVSSGPIGWQVPAPAGGGGGGANTALSNLSSPTPNATMLPQTGVSLGSAAAPFDNIFFYGSGTYGSTSMELTGTPTGNRVWAFQDASDTVVGRATTDALTNKTVNGLTITSSTGTVTIVNGKTVTVDNTIEFAGTDSTKMTFPSTSATIGQAIAAQNSPARACTTPYQNIGSTPRFLGITAHSSSQATISILSDYSATPSVTVAYGSMFVAGITSALTLNAIVMPGNYYELIVSTGTCTVDYWTEWQ